MKPSPCQGYRYSRIDGLADPPLYQYAEYEGISFIKDYKECRAAALSRLVDAHNTELGDAGFRASGDVGRYLWYRKVLENVIKGLTLNDLQGYDSVSIDRPGLATNRMETLDFLRRLLIQGSMAEGPASEDANLHEGLMRRYEVTKKLFASYTWDFERRSGRSDDLEIYALFSIISLRRYLSTWDLRFLSVSLKVNDVLCSPVLPEPSVIMSLLSAAALSLELEAFERLSGSMGVHL